MSTSNPAQMQLVLFTPPNPPQKETTKANMSATNPSVAERVFGTTELFENIFDRLDANSITRCRQVSKTFQHQIINSTKLREIGFLAVTERYLDGDKEVKKATALKRSRFVFKIRLWQCTAIQVFWSRIQTVPVVIPKIDHSNGRWGPKMLLLHAGRFHHVQCSRFDAPSINLVTTSEPCAFLDLYWEDLEDADELFNAVLQGEKLEHLMDVHNHETKEVHKELIGYHGMRARVVSHFKKKDRQGREKAVRRTSKMFEDLTWGKAMEIGVTLVAGI